MMVVMLNVSCGVVPNDIIEKEGESESKSDSSANLFNGGFNVDGYISPLNISVNGKQYKDSEDFYTQELARLQQQVKKEYPQHTLAFDAAVGLKNFKTGMYVFLAAASDSGIASESYVDSSGKFSFAIGSEVDNKSQYLLRATKRIGLRLTKGTEVIAWCYNMYAEKEIALESSPVILRNFETVVTEYQCSEPSEGISLPTNESEKDIVTDMDAQWEQDRKKEQERVAKLNAQIAEAE